jgi:hypothetical protein
MRFHPMNLALVFFLNIFSNLPQTQIETFISSICSLLTVQFYNVLFKNCLNFSKLDYFHTIHHGLSLCENRF